MKYAVLLCLAALSYDALAMNGRNMRHAGVALSQMSSSVGQGLWGFLP